MNDKIRKQAQRILAKSQIGRRKLAEILGVSERQSTKLINEFKGSPAPASKRTTKAEQLAALQDAGYDTYDIAKRYQNSPVTVNRQLKKINGEYDTAAEWVKKAAKGGVKLSYLKTQIDCKSKARAKEILSDAFPGCFIAEIAEDKDTVLIPIADNRKAIESFSVDTQEKKFQYYVSPDSNYMSVVFDDDLPGDKIKIYNLSDVHVGSKAHRGKLFKAIIQLIAKDPMAFAVLGGDMGEFNTRNSAGHANEQYVGPNGQVEEIVTCLSPIAHKLLGYQWGNHEDRIMKFGDFDVGKAMAQMLKIPYFRVRVTIDYFFRGVKKCHMHTHHYGSGVFKKETIKAKVYDIRSRLGYRVNWHTSGHTHEYFVEDITVTTAEPGRGIGDEDDYIVNAGSFTADTGTYSEEAGYFKCPKNVSWIEFDDQGNHFHGSIPIRSL